MHPKRFKSNVKNMECFAIVSHHARMRCFLNKWLEGPNNPNNILKMKFNNASVLEIYFRDINNISINVVWSGGDAQYTKNVDNGDAQYTKNVDNGDAQYTNVDNGDAQNENVVVTSSNYVGGKPYATTNVEQQTYRYKIRGPESESQFKKIQGKTFIIVRHGEGAHNAASKWSKYLNPSIYKDAELTDKGKIQAKNAGKALKHWLVEKNMEINMFFVSDLQRTHQTCREVLKVLYPNGPKPKMYILPCLYELSDGCDSHWKNWYTAYENATLNYDGADLVQNYNAYPDKNNILSKKRSSKYCEQYNVFVEANVIYQEVNSNKYSANTLVEQPSFSGERPTRKGGRRKTRRLKRKRTRRK